MIKYLAKYVVVIMPLNLLTLKFKALLPLTALMFAITATSQNKIFSFNQIQSRNNQQQWDPLEKISERTACFSKKTIDFRLDRNYHLNIVKTTHLPDKGVIYLCKDENQQDVTIMLIANEKMFLYNDQKRFQINFSAPMVMQSVYKLYAVAD